MKELSLSGIALELLQIDKEFKFHLESPTRVSIKDFSLDIFEQTWGNTSGGFEGFGGSAMTTEMTYVLTPILNNEKCQVYFGGKYAYSVEKTSKFLSDINTKSIKGMSSWCDYVLQD